MNSPDLNIQLALSKRMCQTNDKLLGDADAALRRLRVLVPTSSAFPGRKDHAFEPLKAAKARWDWQIDIVCKKSVMADYQRLAAPAGKLFVEPNLHLDTATWESDLQSAEILDGKIQQAENITGVPIGQIVLAADARIGRGFVAPVIKLPYTPDAPQIYELHNLEPFRVIRRLFHRADELLEQSAPDVVYGYDWSLPWLYVVWLAARRRGIPCVAARRSKIRSGGYFFTADPLLFNLGARSMAAELRQANGAVSDVGREYLSAFRDQPRVVKYIQKEWERRSKDNWLAWHRAWVSSTIARTVQRVARRKTRSTSDLKRLIDYNRGKIYRRRHRHILKTLDESELEAMKYVLYPMHKEADLPLRYQAAAWFDQRGTARLLASVLPNGYRLLIREHRRNYGLRPEAFYRELSMLPNVVLIDALDSQFKYVRNADLIVTENGSSGWEGLIFGRRVLTLSQTFYDGAGLARKLEGRDSLARAVLESLATEQVSEPASHDRDLACMVQAEYETTFAEGDMAGALQQFSAVISPLVGRRRKASA